MTDQPADLRQLIAQAIHRYDNHHALSGNDIPSRHHYGEADAVLAVLDAAGIRDAARQAAGQPAAADTIGLCGYCGVPRESHHHGYVSTADAIAAAPHRVTAAGQPDTQQQTETQPPLYVWMVWREDEPIHGVYGTEDDAKTGSIDCWEEAEERCPDYSWRPDGGRTRWELLVGDERSEVYVSRQTVYGRHWVTARAAAAQRTARVLAECDAMEQAMVAGHASLSRLREHIARIRRVADEAQ